jgi:hypothetical protein
MVAAVLSRGTIEVVRAGYITWHTKQYGTAVCHVTQTRVVAAV